MKKFLLCAAVIMLLGFSSCSSGREEPPPDLGPVNSPEASAEATAGQFQSASPSGALITAWVTEAASSISASGVQKEYPDIVGRNGSGNFSGGSKAICADNYIYFPAGTDSGEKVDFATYRMDTRTEEIEFFSHEVMENMFIVDEWIYFNVCDKETGEAASYRMHSDGTDKTRLSYVIPSENLWNNVCYMDGYIYYFEFDSSNPRTVLYRRLISGEDEPFVLMKCYPGERFMELCTDGEHLFYLLDSQRGRFAYKIEGLQSVPLEGELDDITYGEGYIWGRYYGKDYELVCRLGIDNGRDNVAYKTVDLMEGFYDGVNLNVYEGYVYIYNYDYIIRTDLNLKNPEMVFEACGNERLIDIIKAADKGVYLLGDYIYVEGIFDFLGGAKNEYAMLVRNDGAEKQTYMLLQSEFEEEELMVWRERL